MLGHGTRGGLRRPGARMQQVSGRFRRDRSGVAALEFAVITPVLLMMVVGALDIGQALILWQETETAAVNIASAAVILASSAGCATSCTSNDVQSSDLSSGNAQLAMSIIYATVPTVASASYGGQFSVILSGVSYTGTSPNQTPVVNWSVPLKVGPGGPAMVNPTLRSCGAAQSSASLAEDSTTLNFIPTANIAQNSPVVVADVHVRYVPFFLHWFVGSIDFWATNLQQPRTGDSVSTQASQVQVVTYDANANDGYNCENSLPS
jgi:Flp pilus assembly protein TadG